MYKEDFALTYNNLTKQSTFGLNLELFMNKQYVIQNSIRLKLGKDSHVALPLFGRGQRQHLYSSKTRG